MPVTVANAGKSVSGEVQIQMEVGQPAEHGGLDFIKLYMQLEIAAYKITSGLSIGWFDEHLAAIQTALPPGCLLEICQRFSFADYHPGGNGIFGDLLCFRQHKAAFAAIESKAVLLALIGVGGENVQETFHCDEFKSHLA